MGSRRRLPEVTRRSDIRRSRRCPGGGGLKFPLHQPARTDRNSGEGRSLRSGLERGWSCQARADATSKRQECMLQESPDVLRFWGQDAARSASQEPERYSRHHHLSSLMA